MSDEIDNYFNQEYMKNINIKYCKIDKTQLLLLNYRNLILEGKENLMRNFVGMLGGISIKDLENLNFQKKNFEKNFSRKFFFDNVIKYKTIELNLNSKDIKIKDSKLKLQIYFEELFYCYNSFKIKKSTLNKISSVCLEIAMFNEYVPCELFSFVPLLFEEIENLEDDFIYIPLYKLLNGFFCPKYHEVFIVFNIKDNYIIDDSDIIKYDIYKANYNFINLINTSKFINASTFINASENKIDIEPNFFSYINKYYYIYSYNFLSERNYYQNCSYNYSGKNLVFSRGDHKFVAFLAIKCSEEKLKKLNIDDKSISMYYETNKRYIPLYKPELSELIYEINIPLVYKTNGYNIYETGLIDFNKFMYSIPDIVDNYNYYIIGINFYENYNGMIFKKYSF